MCSKMCCCLSLNSHLGATTNRYSEKPIDNIQQTLPGIVAASDIFKESKSMHARNDSKGRSSLGLLPSVGLDRLYSYNLTQSKYIRC